MLDVDDKNELLGELTQAKVLLDQLIEQLVFDAADFVSMDRIADVESHLHGANKVWGKILVTNGM